jgi:hypothetical protein
MMDVVIHAIPMMMAIDLRGAGFVANQSSER